MQTLRNYLSLIVLIFLAAVVLAGYYTFNHVREEAYHQAELNLERQIKTFWELVYAKGDQFCIRQGRLLIGSYETNGNYELPDKIKAIFGGTATIFMGDTRVSTNVPKEDGSRAMGTKLVGPAYDAVFKQGIPYRGEVAILGKLYLTAYDPIRNAQGDVIGALYVGVEKGMFLDHYNHLLIIFLTPVAFLAVVTMMLYLMLLSQGRRAEQTQKRNLHFLQALIDTLPTPVFYKDSQGHYLGCNLAFESMFKLSRSDVIGKTAYDVVPPELAAQYVEHDCQLLDAPLGATHQYESKIRTAEGMERDVIFYKARFEDDSDSSCGIIGTLLDITERKHIELRERARADILEHIAKDASLKEVLTSIALEVEQEQPEVICSIMLVNEDGTKLLGSAAPTLPKEYVSDIHETVIEDRSCCCATAAFSRRRVISSDIAAIYNCQRASTCGLKSCWAEPLLSSKGELLGTLALYSKRVWEPGADDIRLIVSSANYASIAIERINTLRALRESERNYRELVENANSIILRMDTGGRITFFNEFAQQFFGYTEEEILGRHLVGSIVPANENNVSSLSDMIGAIWQDPDRFALRESENMRKNGEQVFISWSNKACLTADGALEEILCIGQDITERRKMQQVMVQTEKMMTVGGLAAGMAHELNNPIGTIAQHTQNIIRRISTGLPANTAVAAETGVVLSSLRAYLERRGIVGMLEAISSSCERAATIIANMLTFSRTSTIQAEFASLVVLVEKSVELALCDYDLKKHYDLKNITIIREYAADIPLVQVVPVEIEQVLLNLLKNAAQALAMYLPIGGPIITIRLKFDDDSVFIELEDNGPGIDKEDIARVFEPFYTTKEVGVGTGLGLSVSYAIIVNRHRGSITVDSPPGKGACFSIRLPRNFSV